MTTEDDPRLPASDRDPEDVHTAVAETVDPGVGRELLAQHSGYLNGLVAQLGTVTDTLVRAQIAHVLLSRFREVRDDALRTMIVTYEKSPKQVAKDVGCSIAEATMACAVRRP